MPGARSSSVKRAGQPSTPSPSGRLSFSPVSIRVPITRSGPAASAASPRASITRVIDPEAASDPDGVEILAEMVQAAVNEAIRSAQELAASKMPDLPDMGGGGGIPGLPGQ